MIEQAFYARLSASAAIATATGGRVYPIHAAQGDAFPFITYQRIGGQPFNTLGGESGAHMARVQVNYQDRGRGGYARVKALADAGRLALSGYAGTAGGVRVQGIRLTAERDEPTTPDDASDSHYFGIQQEYEAWFTQAVPSFA